MPDPLLNIEKINQEPHEGQYYRENNICYDCKQPIMDTDDPWEVFIDKEGHTTPICAACDQARASSATGQKVEEF